MFQEHHRRDDAEARILPLINVVFLLLIFFMVLGSLSATEPFTVGVPDSANQAEPPPQPLRLLMGDSGQLALDGIIMTEAELLQEIRARVSDNPAVRLQLKADGQIPANQIVVFMETLREVGVEKLFLVTQPVES
ncbi:MAG: biopolymer transporter ExbD [Pseudomonadota bacterium]